MYAQYNDTQDEMGIRLFRILRTAREAASDESRQCAPHASAPLREECTRRIMNFSGIFFCASSSWTIIAIRYTFRNAWNFERELIRN